MSVPGPTRRQLGLALALVAGVVACGSNLALGAGAPTVRALHGCYVVRQPVDLRGAGFAPSQTYALSIDGVYFGRGSTDARGSFAAQILAGGLPAGVPQSVDRVQASDGVSTASTAFTLTRAAGARFLAFSGGGTDLRARVQAWDFSPHGARRGVYLHYVQPSGGARTTVLLGHTSGQCGYLRSAPITVFPFTPSRGAWTFQIDTHRRYSHRPRGAVARIPVNVR